MHKLFWLFTLLLTMGTSYAQELNANVSVVFSQLGNTKQVYFQSLEKSLKEFINTTTWSNKKFGTNEKIDCVFLLTVNSFDGTSSVSGSLQVQFTRPVYGSTYTSPVLNFNDKDIAFTYNEFEMLRYSEGTYESNLTSLIGFYVNMILGMDADTFSLEGGTEYFQKAALIASVAQQSNAKGWSQSDGTNTRYYFVSDMNAGTGKSFRKALYNYHRLGMDLMNENIEGGREGVYNALNELQNMHNTRPNSFLMRIFFDTKTEELTNIFSGVRDKNKNRVIEILNKVSPLNASKWNSL
ncbi:MAG: DUF4835 family protein [Flavobacteriaceae bacterium]|nr:DUF4835 family protein [Flavobacteriaceae bacterium]